MTSVAQDWSARGTGGHERHGQWAVYDSNGRDIAIVYDGAAHGPLIAAAPDLLAALRNIDSNAAESVEWIRRVAREAIRKAEGGAA
jgi:hypothetical protein